MGLKVLIVDDSSVMRKILERSLRQAAKAGIDSVVEAADGNDALAKLGSEQVELIFTDINMPNCSGLEFLRRLKETPYKDLPVIMVTTEGGEKVVQEAIGLGAKGFVRKPFTPEQMQAVLAKVTS
jgi:two-component system chemotaxis response regulator CheY